MHIVTRIKYFLCFIFFIPAIILYYTSSNATRRLIDSDIQEMNKRTRQQRYRRLPYWLFFHQSYRNLFYYRIGKKSQLVSWYLRPYPLFFIRVREGIGENAYVLNHPFSTTLGAKRIGKNFTVCQLTTIGNKGIGRTDFPILGDNVNIGANVSIIGNITIGNNVEIGAGSVVVKDIPDNCVVAGNPARIIRRK